MKEQNEVQVPEVPEAVADLKVKDGAFSAFRIEDIDAATKDLINKTTTLVQFTQDIIMGFAERLESEHDAAHLTKFIHSISEMKGDKLMLSATARSVGVYMKAYLPLVWKDNEFRYQEDLEDFDWAKAREGMLAVRWDRYQAMDGNNAFNAENKWKAIITAAKDIIKHKGELHEEDVHYASKAETLLRSFGIQA